MEKVNVKIKKLNENAVIPFYAHPGEDAGLDIIATSYEYKKDIDAHVYGCGLAFELPKGYYLKAVPRSSNRKTDCYLTNHSAIGDSGYRNEYFFTFKNRTSSKVANLFNLFGRTILQLCAPLGIKLDFKDMELKKPYEVGDKIVQIQILPYPEVIFEEVNELSESERGLGGYGSTGK